VLAIETSALTKEYTTGFWRKRPHRALDALDLQVEQGGVFGFLGPNGAGKTTTLKLLMQLVYPTSGGATLLGKPIGSVDAKRRIGYLPESPYFYDYLTAEELLMYFARLFGYTAADGRARAARLLDEIGIGAERRWPLRKYSKGMLQRVGIAQALINDPELVILDEPMSGLDPLGRRDVRSLILRLRDRGCTVFFSSHVLSDAEALCGQVAILANGKLVAGGHLSTIIAFEKRGWELVMSEIHETIVARLGARARKTTKLASGRYTFELPLHPSPEQLIAELVGGGATLISLTPVHDTLEDFFVRQVAGAPASREGRS
jgi:ABC-2 type transport system ATP-binding protein